jgi:hypothetical protein
MAGRINYTLSVAMTNEQINTLQRVASDDGCSVSKTVRQLILVGLRQRHLREHADEFETNGKTK